MTPQQDRRLKALTDFLAHVRERLALDIGFFLWNGVTVPDNLSADAFGIHIADEGVVAALIRKPSVETLGQLFVAERIDLRNGTLFDLVARRPAMRTKQFLKSLDRMMALKLAAKFLFVSRGGPWPLDAMRQDRQSDGSVAENTKNISYHYDVSNAFYDLFLDSDMVYTCAYFHTWDDDLATAQRNKLDMVCRKLRLQLGDRLLDIGCGWGALICHAAQHYGAICEGITLSQEQLLLTQEKIRERGLDGQVSVRLQDYADVQGEYDKISSVGMIEAIGLDHLPKYYATINRLLKPGGLYLNHGITRPGRSQTTRHRKKRPEFAALTKYVFPGGELDFVGNTITLLERANFEVHDVEDWREHYMRTCRIWHDNLLRNLDAAYAEIGRVKTRIWLVYLAGSSISFQRNSVLLYQTLASKRVKGPVGLPPTRADLYR